MEGKLNEWIKLFRNTLKDCQTLFIIDDCFAEGEINRKRDALSELAFSIRHRNHRLWVLTQKYNSISKDVREQLKWLCLFFTKDRDSFEDCLRGNDVVPDKNERDRLKKCLQTKLDSKKLILKCYQSTGYYLLQFVTICFAASYNFADIYYSASNNFADIYCSASYIAS